MKLSLDGFTVMSGPIYITGYSGIGLVLVIGSASDSDQS